MQQNLIVKMPVTNSMKGAVGLSQHLFCQGFLEYDAGSVMGGFL